MLVMVFFFSQIVFSKPLRNEMRIKTSTREFVFERPLIDVQHQWWKWLEIGFSRKSGLRHARVYSFSCEYCHVVAF